MKGSNEFVYFLFAGLIILAVLIAAFGLTFQKAETSKPHEGFIVAIKTFTIPYVIASDVLQTQIADLESRWVQNGLLFGEEKITYSLIKSGLQDVTINFRVTSTNGLGKLMIKVNNNIIENRIFDPGVYSIKVNNELVKEKNQIEIAAESSWFRIWAPNLYKIADASIVYTSFSEDFSQYKFYLGEEYISFEFAKADLVFEENIGTLIVGLNGREIWKSPTNDLQSIKLDKIDLRLGDNIIAFKASDNSQFVGVGKIAVGFLTAYPERINQTGIVTAVQPFVGYSNQFYR